MKTKKAAAPFYSLVSLTLLFLCLSCEKSNIITEPPRVFSAIKAWDYSEDHYFLDTIYKSSYVNFYNDAELNFFTNRNAVDENTFEVWVQVNTSSGGNYRKAGLHIDLPALPAGGYYNDSLKRVHPEQGIRDFGFVRKLDPEEYKLHKHAGYVSFTIDIPDNYFAGVAYKRFNTGEQFGTISSDPVVSPTDTLVLKMIKVSNLIPQNIIAWELKLKSIYRLSVKQPEESTFDFQIYYHSDSIYTPFIPGLEYLTILSILKLDKYIYGGQVGSDLSFDFRPGITIDIENHWIIFPDLKPFSEGFQNFNNPLIGPEYLFPEIYQDLKQNVQLSPNADKYDLMESFPKPD